MFTPDVGQLFHHYIDWRQACENYIRLSDTHYAVYAHTVLETMEWRVLEWEAVMPEYCRRNAFHKAEECSYA